MILGRITSTLAFTLITFGLIRIETSDASLVDDSRYSLHSYTNFSSHENTTYRSLPITFKRLSFMNLHHVARLVLIPKWLLGYVESKPFPDHLLSDVDLTNYDQLADSLKRNYGHWLNYERGFIIVVALFCILTLTFGSVYFFRIFCCHARVRIRKKCTNSDYQSKSFKRYCSNSALFFLLVLICLFIVYAFLYNHQANGSIETLNIVIEKNEGDLEDYRRNTLEGMRFAMIEKYFELKQRINRQLDDSMDDFITFAFDALKATLFEDLSHFTTELELLNNIMKKMILNLNDSGIEIGRLESNITEVESWLLDQLNDCLNDPNIDKQSQCKKALALVRKHADSSRSSASDFDKDIRKQGRLLRTLLWSLDASAISRNISESLDLFRLNIRNELTGERKKIDQTMTAIEKTLNRTWIRLSDSKEQESIHTDRILFVLKDKDENGEYSRGIHIAIDLHILFKVDVSNVKTQVKQYQEMVLKLEYYRWLLSLVSCSIIAFIVLCLFIGLIFSVCGSKPHFLRKSCFSWSRSTCWFLSAAFFTSISITFLSIVICTFFIVGGNSWTLICENFETFDPEMSPMFKILQRYWKIHRSRLAGVVVEGRHSDYAFLADYDLKIILQGCQENKTLFSIFDLGRKFKFNETFELNQQIGNISKHYRSKLKDIKVDSNIIQSFQRISNTHLATMKNSLQSSYFSHSHLDDLHKMLESFNFEENLSLLQQAANKFQYSDLNGILNTVIGKLQQVNEENVANLRRLNIEFLNHFNYTAQRILPAVIRPLENIAESEKSEIFQNLTDNLSTYSANLAEILFGNLSSSSNEYVNNLRNKLESEVTSCRPILEIVSNTFDAVCEGVIDPINMLWVCIGMALLLLMLAVALAYNLRSFYINVLRCDMDSRGSDDSRRCIVDAYSTVTDDYGCYRRGSDSSYHGEISRNLNVIHLKYPTDCDNFALENSLPSAYSRPK